MSGPIIMDSPIADGYVPGDYKFYYTNLYDMSKQESLPYLFGDAGDRNRNRINVVGNQVMFNFDFYINPYDDTPSLGMSKRITGARAYYKTEGNDDYFLIGELDYVKNGFKWTPYGDTSSYDIVNTSSSDNRLLKSCIVKGVSPVSANTIDTYSNINGFGGNVRIWPCLGAGFRSGRECETVLAVECGAGG